MIVATRNVQIDRDALATLRDLGAPPLTASATDTSVPAYELGADGQIISRLPRLFSVAITVPDVDFGDSASVIVKVLVDDSSGMANAPAEIGRATINGPGSYRVLCEIPAAQIARGQANGLHVATRGEILGVAKIYYAAHITPA